MAISVNCPSCGKALKAPDEAAGKQARCPQCKTQFKLAAPEPADDSMYKLSAEEPPPRPGGYSLAPPATPEKPPHREPPVAGGRVARSPSSPATGTAKGASHRSSAEPEHVGAGARHWIFALTLIPLVFMLLLPHDEIEVRLQRMIEAHPELLEPLRRADSAEELCAALPNGRLDDAHLSHTTWLHWGYGLAAAVLFFGLIRILFDQDGTPGLQLLAVGLVTATVGIVMLLAFQWIAGWTQGVMLRGRGIVVLLFYIVKLIGFSYRAALDPANGFLASFFGFTFGVGLCEEFTKALPVYLKLRDGNELSWRAACVWGLASGAGFGIAEGIMYAANHYNGIATFGIYPVRFISCVALHAAWTGAVAIMTWHSQELISGEMDWGDWILALGKVQGVPMLLHGLYDTLLKRDMNALALVAAVASFAWLGFLIHHSASGEDEVRVPARLVGCTSASARFDRQSG